MQHKLSVGVIAILTFVTVGCAKLSHVIYRPDINQGNYLTKKDIAKVHIGMTQQQVGFALGTPMLKDPFGSNVWYYVFRKEPGHKKAVQQTLTLTFNKENILTSIDDKPGLATDNIGLSR